MIKVRYQQLDVWPRKPTLIRKTSQFKASYGATLDLLDSEIDSLSGTDVIVQGFWPKGSTRGDGWPLVSARTPHPGVAIIFSTASLGNLSYHTDRFDCWEDNLRGIALTLHALRAIRRYGTVADDEQYRGFTAIEAPHVSNLAAAATLIRLAGGELVVGEQPLGLLALTGDLYTGTVDKLRRLAIKKVHPDVGGSLELMTQLDAAVKILMGAK